MQTINLQLDQLIDVGKSLKQLKGSTLPGKAVYAIARNLVKLETILREYGQRYDAKIRELSGGETIQRDDPKAAVFAEWNRSELKTPLDITLFYVTLTTTDLDGLDPVILTPLLTYNILTIVDPPEPTPMPAS